MSTETSALKRRLLPIVSALMIVIGGVAWTGCGKSTEDKVNDAINNAEQQSKKIQGEVNKQVQQAGQKAQAAANKAKGDASAATQQATEAAAKATKDAQKQAQDAQKAVQDAINNAGG